MRSVTAIAERNEVGGVVYPSSRTRDQVVDVSFAPGTWLAARSARVGVAGEHDGADGAPLFPFRLVRWLRKQQWLVIQSLTKPVEYQL